MRRYPSLQVTPSPLSQGFHARAPSCRDPAAHAGPPRQPAVKILIVTDAWTPQLNGVVRTVQMTVRELAALGHIVEILAPDLFRSLPCPGYAEIRLALA